MESVASESFYILPIKFELGELQSVDMGAFEEVSRYGWVVNFDLPDNHDTGPSIEGTTVDDWMTLGQLKVELS